MSEYRKQILLKGLVAAVIGASLVIGIAFLPLQLTATSSLTTARSVYNSSETTASSEATVSTSTATATALGSTTTFSASSASSASTVSSSSLAISSTATQTFSSTTSNNLTNFGRNVTTLSVGLAPYGLAYNTKTQDTFVAVSGNDSVVIIGNRSQVIGRINLGEQVDFVGFDPVNNFLYAYLPGSNSVAMINASLKVTVARVGVGAGPGWLTFDPASQTMYAMNRESNSISVISNTTVVKNISVSGLPFAAAYNQEDHNMYVTSNFGSVFVINGTSNSLTRTIDVGGASSDLLGIAYSLFDHYMYVTSYSDGRVYVLNSTSVVTWISGFNSPIGIAFSTNQDVFYVANSANSTVSAWSDNNSATSPVLNDPREILFESQLNRIIVTNYGNSSVTVITA